ncbi:hypothetical protein [Streptomyces sp. NPDC056144]|uniref:hypothetical protein n=1 Tax=unclassified Streptomyces TaxID=2593676 RepID=UPI0035E0167C
MSAAELDHGPRTLSPASSGEILDRHGLRWTKSRGPLDVRLAKRLVKGADEMIIGEGAGETLRSVPAEGRAEAWALIKRELHPAEHWRYRAFDFRSEDGRVLLYVEESC